MQETIGNFEITPSDVANTFHDVQRKDVWNRLWDILTLYDAGATSFSQLGLTTADPDYKLAYSDFHYWAKKGRRPHAVKAVHELRCTRITSERYLPFNGWIASLFFTRSQS